MLVSGIVSIIICAFLILVKNSTVIVPILAAAVLFIYFLKKKALKKYIIIPTVCICSLIFTASFVTYNRTRIEPLIQYNNKELNIYGRVNDTPVFRYDHTTFTLKTDKINYDDVNTNISVSLYGDFTEDIKLFDYISLHNTYVTVPEGNDNSYNLSSFADGTILEADDGTHEFLYECKKSLYYYTLNLKELMCNKISAFTDKNQGGLLKGILFGDTADIDSQTNKAFKASGISHLLAVSGMHTTLYCSILISILSAFGVSEKLRNGVCLVFLVFFCIISSFTPSVLRAAIMMAVILSAPFFKREPDSINSLGLSVCLLVLFNPYIILNIGFQLSASATLGVLYTEKYKKKISSFTAKFNEKHLVKLTDAVLSSLIISFFAAVFTLPISAYHFGVFSILSPITNILTVRLSFYATILGIAGTALGFIDVYIIKEATVFIFKITQFIIDIIIEAALFISKIKYCTIPIHKDFLIASVIISALLLSTGYVFYKIKRNSKVIKAFAVLSIAGIFTFCSIPIIIPQYKTQVTVINNKNGIAIAVRSGTSYAFIENTAQYMNSRTFDYLPKATSENLKYYFPVYLSTYALNHPEIIEESCNIGLTVMPQSLYDYLKKEDNFVPDNTKIQNNGKFNLSNEINIEIVDTYRIKYAIIRGNKKNLFIHLYGDTDFSKAVDTSDCDIAVFNSVIPEEIPKNAESVILSGELLTGEFYNKFPTYEGTVLTTAQAGDIQFYI